MASLLRQIVAGPRARHPEAGLDLCYVTDTIIATSGPSGTYPQRAYRNPLDELVKFLDSKHKDNWAIWEFRAEGTGYPDDEVYGRIYHYPFPDHHPPPFALIPNIVGGMRNWLHGGEEKGKRVVVVHCKAGKGRSGTASVSYLVAEEGWKVKDALNRFTERRMKPNWGPGVSIPSQLRWIGYVERWAKGGKIYVERQVEVLEVHCWGLRDGVKIQIEGFVEDGKVIKSFHTFAKSEREIVRGEIQKSGGISEVVSEVMGRSGLGRSGSKKGKNPVTAAAGKGDKVADLSESDKEEAGLKLDGTTPSKDTDDETEEKENGDVVFRPSKRVVLPTNDLNIDVERRNKAAFDLTMVTSVAHVWINAFFEGNGPEQDGVADEGGVFEITWEAMDGIKGSSRKGTQAFDKIAVVWKAPKPDKDKIGIVVTEPAEGEEIKQMSPADWRGRNHIEPGESRDLGLRTSSPPESSENVSKASSIKSQHTVSVMTAPGPHENSTDGVRSHGPAGEEHIAPANEAAPAPETMIIAAPSAGSGPVGNTVSSPSAGSVQVDGSVNNDKALDDGRALDKQGVAGLANNYGVDGTQHVSTGDLPDGIPEAEMKTANEHALGHLARNSHHTSS
ncbi:hypothetical protein P154DRAFT_458843 [Amniculicola lignicola CBS 123094]|uniref:phosphatidylinositol-3,4,5-trisphosphate 3-phosphatase n=1 Tax=Amniculicola lignicola CBS 123094 TaxID=1392246 RepID=A0A6A5WX75_9PLEO|nr:hypothetical protein P154DRAFT_458843 [Amniculicola lignicola CBS 123094]